MCICMKSVDGTVSSSKCRRKSFTVASKPIFIAPQIRCHLGFGLGALIRRLSADKPPTRVPSRPECRFCDITAKDCPDRVDSDAEPREGTNTDF